MSSRIVFHIGYHKTASTWLQRVAMPLQPNARLYLDGALGDDPFLREIILTSDASFDPAITRRLFDERVNALGVPADGVVVV